MRKQEDSDLCRNNQSRGMFILLKIDLGDTFLSLSPVIIDDGDFYEKIFNIYSVFSGSA